MKSRVLWISAQNTLYQTNSYSDEFAHEIVCCDITTSRNRLPVGAAANNRATTGRAVFPPPGQDLGAQPMAAPLKQRQTKSKCVEGSCHLHTLLPHREFVGMRANTPRQAHAPYVRFRANTCAVDQARIAGSQIFPIQGGAGYEPARQSAATQHRKVVALRVVGARTAHWSPSQPTATSGTAMMSPCCSRTGWRESHNNCELPARSLREAMPSRTGKHRGDALTSAEKSVDHQP